MTGALKSFLKNLFRDESSHPDREAETGPWGKGVRRVDAALFWLLAAVLAAAICIYFWHAVQVLPLKYEFKSWAGGNAMHCAWLLSQGRNFYIDPVKEPSTGGCYPPGFFIIMASLIRVFGLKIWVGRAASMAGLALVWAVMYVVTARMSGERKYGLFAIGLIMVPFGAMRGHWDSIHPDSWTVFWGLLTLFLAEASVSRRAWIIPAAIACAFSFFTKQTGIGFGAGAALYLLLRRPPLAFIYVGLVGALIGVGYLIGQKLTDGMLWRYTVLYAIEQPILKYYIRNRLPEILAMFSGAIFVLALCMLDRPKSLRLLSPYALSLPIIFVVYGAGAMRRGGSLSNFFPALVLGSMLLAVGLSHIRNKMIMESPIKAFVLLLILLIQCVWLLRELPYNPDRLYHEAARAVERIVQETEGEVLVYHRISFAYLNGRPIYDNQVELFDHYTWRDYSRLEGQLKNRYFTRIIIPKASVDIYTTKTPIKRLLRENYYVEDIIPFPSWKQVYPLMIYHRIENGAAEKTEPDYKERETE